MSHKPPEPLDAKGKYGRELVLSEIFYQSATQADVIRGITRVVWGNAFCVEAAQSATIEPLWFHPVNDDPGAPIELTFEVWYYAGFHGYIKRGTV